MFIGPVYQRTHSEGLLTDESFLNIAKATEIDVSLGSVTAHCRFLVFTEFHEDIWFGLDFLRQYNTTIVCAGVSISIKTSPTSTKHASSSSTTSLWAISSSDITVMFPLENGEVGNEVQKTMASSKLSKYTEDIKTTL